MLVGSRFSGQVQDAWDLRPVSPIQEICREWAKELGFSVWTTSIMVFLMGRVYQRELVLGTVRGAFSGASDVLVGSSLFLFLFTLFL